MVVVTKRNELRRKTFSEEEKEKILKEIKEQERKREREKQERQKK